MSSMQWLLLILVVATVAGAYFFLRRQADGDPWRDMSEAEDPEDFDDSESLGGDSYVVGVRTLGEQGQSSQPPQAEVGGGPHTDANAEEADSWQAFSTGQSPSAGQSASADQSPSDSRPDRAESLRPQRPPAGEQRLFILHIARRDQVLFDGPDIHRALQDSKLKFGLNDIYHRITEVNGVPESVFCVANMVKPGFLDPVEQDQLHTPGLTAFLQLPGPIDGPQAARDLLETVSAVAERLGAEVLDDRRSLLKAQTAQFMLDEVAEMERKRRLTRQR